ncbi:group I truncated hemoglobin [Pseudomonas sp. HK3]
MQASFKLNLNIVITIILALCIYGCSTVQKNNRLFEQLGGHDGIALLTDAFIEQIQYDKDVMPYFLKTDVARFREKFIEQICMISEGPCQYTGDTMKNVHTGMDINEHHFNAIVDDLIMAMDSIDLPTATQNQLLCLLAPMRKDIIYR